MESNVYVLFADYSKMPFEVGKRRTQDESSDMANVLAFSKVKRSPKNWVSVLDSLADSDIGLERSPNGTGANVVLW